MFSYTSSSHLRLIPQWNVVAATNIYYLLHFHLPPIILGLCALLLKASWFPNILKTLIKTWCLCHFSFISVALLHKFQRFLLHYLPSCPNLLHCLVIKMLLGCFFSSNSCTQSFNLFLFVSDEEADSGGDPGQAVEKLLSVILRNKALNPSDCDSDKRSSWVHCGKTKVFLTQLMVSIDMQIFSHCEFNVINM